MAHRISRRQFLELGAAGLAASVLTQVKWPAPAGAARGGASWLPSPSVAYAFSQSTQLKKFVQPLRKVGADIPIAQPDTANPGWWQPGATHYTIDIGQYEDQLHPDLPNPTRLWGYGQNGNFKHLGGVIAAKRDNAVQITFRNNLPPDHILPVDDTIMGVMGNQYNRVVTHLHGGFVPWISDGGPHAWWDPDGHKGPVFLNNDVLRSGQIVPANEAEFYYPNHQGSRLMWYHDHAFGLTRLNAYAGIASGYVVYDDYELELVAKNHLPGPLDPRTIYLVFQDKIFVRADIDASDPTWSAAVKNTRAGDLWYAHEYDPTKWDLAAPGNPPPVSAIPEFFGDTILVNGTVYPVLDVEPRQYRFRMLNACSARFLNPRLMFAKGLAFPNNTEVSKLPGPPFIQIGNEAGFLSYPAPLNEPFPKRLLLAPAERADLIVDFRLVPPGATLLLCGDAPAPYPMGDPANDYFVGNTANPTTTSPGYGPNTRTLMAIRIKPRQGKLDSPITLPLVFTPTDPFMIRQKPLLPTRVPRGVPVRYVTLNETSDEFGRLIQMLGTDSVGPYGGTFSQAYMDTPTEVVHKGATEVWEIINLTGDTHPVHFHLVNVQVLSRQPFDAVNYAGGAPTYTGDATAPDVNELGWKETVRVNPGEVTRVIMQFNLPAAPFAIPESPRTGGHEYVWHCHILEHEEHDMMRPLVVTDP